MAEALTSQTIQQNTLEREQNTNVAKNLTEHIQTNARGTNIPNNQTQHTQDSAQGTNVTNSQQKTYKTVRKTLT